jgi:hypothetical protein
MPILATAATKRAKVNVAAGQTASELVAAVTGKSICVLAVIMVTGATATTAVFNSASTAVSCLFANAANGGAVLPFNPAGWFATAVGEALTVTTGAGATTGFQIIYTEE